MAKAIVAIMYDFDKTLCTKDMQNYKFIQDVGMTPAEFWGATNKITEENNMDKILAYMYMMVKQCKNSNIKLTKEYLKSLGSYVELFKGVETWFQRINSYGEALGLKIEHYVISSGTKEIIEGTSIVKEFKKIYACEFLYNENKEAIWPTMAINYTNKTQFLFRISKGVLDATDEITLNQATPTEDRRVQYRNMIYIGDGLTDIPCMKLVKDRGGKAIALYQFNQKDKVLPLVSDGRINYACMADYRENSRLEKIVKLILDSMDMQNKLDSTEQRILNEYINSVEKNNE